MIHVGRIEETFVKLVLKKQYQLEEYSSQMKRKLRKLTSSDATMLEEELVVCNTSARAL
jgi:hypothetical protein